MPHTFLKPSKTRTARVVRPLGEGAMSCQEVMQSERIKRRKKGENKKYTSIEIMEPEDYPKKTILRLLKEKKLALYLDKNTYIYLWVEDEERRIFILKILKGIVGQKAHEDTDGFLSFKTEEVIKDRDICIALKRFRDTLEKEIQKGEI